MNREESNKIVAACVPLMSRDFPRWIIKTDTDLPYPKETIKEALKLEFLALQEEEKDMRTVLAMCWMELSHFVPPDDARLIYRYEESMKRGETFGAAVTAEKIAERIRKETDQLAVDLQALRQGVQVQRTKDGMTIILPKFEGPSKQK